MNQGPSQDWRSIGGAPIKGKPFQEALCAIFEGIVNSSRLVNMLTYHLMGARVLEYTQVHILDKIN